MLQEVFRAGKEESAALGRIGLRKVRRCVAALTFALVALVLCFGGEAQAAKRSVAVTAQVPVVCEAKGIKESFSYAIRDASGALAAQKLTLTDGKEGSFTLRFTSAGKYSYTVTQEAGTSKDVTYDTSVFRVEVYVEETDGALHAQPILYRDGGEAKLMKLTFVNTAKDTSGGSTGGDGTGDDSNNGSTGDNPGGSTGGDGTGDDSSNGGTGSGDGSNGGTGSGDDGKEDGTGNGSGSGSGSDGNGSSNGSGNGSAGSGSDSNGSGNASGDSSSFWGNGSFWGSSSSTGSTGSSLVSTLVRTGDSAKVLLWTGLFILALTAAIGAWRCKKNQEHKINRKDREDG